jgi:Coenzyme PQQ synthesis protein D (PqqD)
VVASKDQISCDLAGEAAILELKSGTYFGLDEVGATVWKLIARPRRVIEIRDALLRQYDVEAERCGQELIELLGALHEQGLIQVAEGHIPNETDS